MRGILRAAIVLLASAMIGACGQGAANAPPAATTAPTAVATPDLDATVSARVQATSAEATVDTRVQATVAAVATPVSSSATSQPDSSGTAPNGGQAPAAPPLAATATPAPAAATPPPAVQDTANTTTTCFITAMVGPSTLFVAIKGSTDATCSSMATQFNQQFNTLSGLLQVSVSGTTNPTPIPSGAQQACSTAQVDVYSNSPELGTQMCQFLQTASQSN